MECPYCGTEIEDPEYGMESYQGNHAINEEGEDYEQGIFRVPFTCPNCHTNSSEDVSISTRVAYIEENENYKNSSGGTE